MLVGVEHMSPPKLALINETTQSTATWSCVYDMHCCRNSEENYCMSNKLYVIPVQQQISRNNNDVEKV